jgi:adenylate cyclase
LALAKQELSQFVSLATRQMVDSVIVDDAAGRDGTAPVTVLFSDMRGFTRLSQNLDAKEVFDRLNHMLTIQIKIVEKNNGFIDKLSGDEIMAVFEGEDMVDNALKSARSIVDVLSSNESETGTAWTSVGIGINTGPVHWGSLGDLSFRDFTVIGNTVNVSARLCGLAGNFQILFTEATEAVIEEGKCLYQSLGKKKIKGLEKPITVFQIDS